jgi:hypothetical protein
MRWEGAEEVALLIVVFLSFGQSQDARIAESGPVGAGRRAQCLA